MKLNILNNRAAWLRLGLAVAALAMTAQMAKPAPKGPNLLASVPGPRVQEW